MIFRARTRTSWPFPLAEALTGCYSNRRKRRLTHLIAPLTIFLITLFFILWRPRGIKEMWFALAGAVVMYALRLVGPGDVADLWAETGTVLVFLAGMLLVGYVADQAGVFSWLAYHTARLSRGNGVLLYVGLYLTGVFVTIWFSLDTTAVVLAPIVYNLVTALGLPPLPFVFATTYVANTASLLLPVSNLTNLIVWNRFDIPFWQFATVMALPAAAAIVVNVAFFLWLFRRDIPKRFSPAPLEQAVASGEAGWKSDPRRLQRNLVMLAAVLLGLAAAPFFGWELWAVALAGGVVMAGVELALAQLRWRQLATEIAWDLLPFVFSLFLILRGVGKSGLSELARTFLLQGGDADSLAQLFTIAATTALGSNLINNLPMLLVVSDSLAEPVLSGQVGLGAVYAALLGTNLGPNLTVIGSLATMLSLSIIGKKGLRVPGLLYVRIGVVTVPLLLAAAVAGLWLALRL